MVRAGILERVDEMRAVKFHCGGAGFICSLALSLSLLLTVGQLFAFAARGNSKAKDHELSEDQRVAHVLSRLTFGARPGDFERVKAMGVEAFIAQQLDPDSLDAGAVVAKLKRLPPLGMATPVIIEQYTPPKPAAVPSPVPAQSPDKTTAPMQKQITQNAPSPLGQTPQIANPNMSAVQNEMQVNAKKEDAGRMPALPDSMRSPDAMAKPGASPEKSPAPKPTPPPKNPQMVVTELQRAKLLRAVYSDRQLYELMVDFWENHFSIFANKDDDRYLLTSYDRDTIRPFAMGRFRDLLGATAHSPAMLYYLDNWRSSVPRPYAATKDKPAGVDGGFNENYARELMELHTLGVDGGYTQKDVQEIARCFSGWTILQPRGGGAAAAAVMGRDARDSAGKFIFRPFVHDNGEKIVLGHKIPAGGGIKDGLMVLDIVAHHPSTAKFIATKLVRRFVSDDPPPALVDRVAQTFIKTDGDIREVLKAIFSSPEFNSADAYRAKVKRPFELAVSAVRTLGADTNGGPQLHQWIARMGQPLYGFQTPNGYADVAESWVNTGALLERMNFALALASNRIPGTRVDLSRFVADVSGTSIDKEKLLDRFVTLIVGGEISPKTRETLLKQLSDQITLPAMPPGQTASSGAPANPFETAFQRGNLNPGGGGAQQQQQLQLARVNPAAIDNPVVRLAGLILGSPEFQKQ